MLSLAFSSSGPYLASTRYEGRLRLWSTHNWGVLGAVLLENKGMQSFIFAPQGGILAIASDHGVTLIDVPLLNIIQKMDLTPKGVYCLAFSPDVRHLARGAAEKRVRVWNLLGEVN